MLVVSRRKHEQIFIGEGEDRITVTICRIDPTSVRVGIEAPRDVPIVRDDAVDKEPKELYEAPEMGEEILVKTG